MVATPPPRTRRVRFLLWFADKLYNTNVRVFHLSGRVIKGLSNISLKVYSVVASWCWVRLVRHCSDEECIAVGNRRLKPLGLELVRKPAPAPVAALYPTLVQEWGRAVAAIIKPGDLN